MAGSLAHVPGHTFASGRNSVKTKIARENTRRTAGGDGLEVYHAKNKSGSWMPLGGCIVSQLCKTERGGDGMEGWRMRGLAACVYDVCVTTGTCVRAITCCREVPAKVVMRMTHSIRNMRVMLRTAAHEAQGRGGDAPHCNLNVLIATRVGAVMHFS